jgi:hypothetical protein
MCDCPGLTVRNRIYARHLRHPWAIGKTMITFRHPAQSLLMGEAFAHEMPLKRSQVSLGFHFTRNLSKCFAFSLTYPTPIS